VLVDVIAIEDAIVPPEELDFVMIGAVAGILLLLVIGLGVIYMRSRRRAPVTAALSIYDGSDGFSAYGRAYSDMSVSPFPPFSPFLLDNPVACGSRCLHRGLHRCLMRASLK
jgi:hypothetical protein